ncbi:MULTISPECIES: hypothetical protein [Butyricimonas]|uniref:hypothetical protein n=1 Tax=Butyricimonas TaxID=574697 RepID=UPI002A814EEE|nr:hypothetical protein [Butyricimonas paravirosa]
MDVVDQIYKLRRNFIVIGLTGRTGSGCTTVADILKKENIDGLKSNYKEINSGDIDNNVRKDRIVYNFIKKNWKPFDVIKASDVIFYYAFQLDFNTFIKSLAEIDIAPINQSKVALPPINQSLIEQLRTTESYEKIKQSYEEIKAEVERCEKFIQEKNYEDSIDDIKKYKKLILCGISEFRRDLEQVLAKMMKKVLAKELQAWGNNIRLYNHVQSLGKINEKSPSCLAHKINQFIKIFRVADKKENKPTLIAIDALRNPYEILYFRERYAAFYTISVNTEENIRQQKLFEKGYRQSEVQELDEAEKGKNDFQKSYQLIDVDKCIELSDIHLTHDGVHIEKNRNLINQIFTYISLILHPGLVPPSPLERIMQVAFTAKLNSGCLSRQVGAAVTNEYYSVQAIGWNTVAEGQTPCSLRNIYDLHSQEDAKAYSTYEKDDAKFSDYINKTLSAYNSSNATEKLGGLTLAYCFKDIHTTINADKQRGNQVHTRSLHAEENAFLQLAKYGSQGIKGGKLFTTASCCELCAKKAYQLGIKEIYYIDSYPGISKRHILECGDLQPKMILFTGAIGRAYINLYNQFLPLKDEIEAITCVNIKNLNSNSDVNQNQQKSKGGTNNGDNNTGSAPQVADKISE